VELPGAAVLPSKRCPGQSALVERDGEDRRGARCTGAKSGRPGRAGPDVAGRHQQAGLAVAERRRRRFGGGGNRAPPSATRRVRRCIIAIDCSFCREGLACSVQSPEGAYACGPSAERSPSSTVKTGALAHRRSAASPESAAPSPVFADPRSSLFSFVLSSFISAISALVFARLPARHRRRRGRHVLVGCRSCRSRSVRALTLGPTQPDRVAIVDSTVNAGEAEELLEIPKVTGGHRSRANIRPAGGPWQVKVTGGTFLP
jgi:hypothetical protein